MAKLTRTTELEPIDRLDEKLKRLVTAVERLRAEQARTAEENARLARELETMRTRLAEAEGVSDEVIVLRQERDVIRARVSDMLEQLDALNL